MRPTYRINDIFYSLQGEGHNTGRAAVFVRFAGCNLRCPFCDTDFDDYREMSIEEILKAIGNYSTRFAVLTGGEPTLQADELFVEKLHAKGYEVAMESNGIRPAPRNLDWLTVSPKKVAGSGQDTPQGKIPDELKVIFEEDTDPAVWLFTLNPPATTELYLQPCDTGNAERNASILQACVDYIKKHPQWRLSLQTHKLIGIK